MCAAGTAAGASGVGAAGTLCHHGPMHRVVVVGAGFGGLSAARALIGKKVGDTVEVNTPGGGKSYEIMKVAFI